MSRPSQYYGTYFAWKSGSPLTHPLSAYNVDEDDCTDEEEEDSEWNREGRFTEDVSDFETEWEERMASRKG